LELRSGSGDPVSMEPVTVADGDLIVRLAALPTAYARTLKVPLTDADVRRMERSAAPTKSVRAFELFARAQMAAARGGQEANENAVDLLSRAIEGAISAYQKALTYNAINPKVYMSLGKIYYAEKGLYYESVQAYRRAIDLDPHSVDARMGLGEVYEDKGLYKEAVEEYRKVIELDDKNTGALYNLA